MRHTARLVPQKAATCRSSSLVRGPVVIQPERRASATSKISSSVISGGEKGIFIFVSFIFFILSGTEAGNARFLRLEPGT